MPDERPVEYVKVKDLTPESKNVNIIVKVVEEGEERSISSKFGGERKLKEFTVGDDTAVVVMTLWEDQVGQASNGDTLQIENGYISLVRGNMRLNIGKYGKFLKAKEPIAEVNKSLNLSAKEYPIPERRGRAGTGFTRYGGLSDYYPRQGGGGGGGGRRDDDRGGGGGGGGGGRDSGGGGGGYRRDDDRRRRERSRY
jgi:replication factor A1